MSGYNIVDTYGYYGFNYNMEDLYPVGPAVRLKSDWCITYNMLTRDEVMKITLGLIEAFGDRFSKGRTSLVDGVVIVDNDSFDTVDDVVQYPAFLYDLIYHGKNDALRVNKINTYKSVIVQPSLKNINETIDKSFVNICEKYKKGEEIWFFANNLIDIKGAVSENNIRMQVRGLGSTAIPKTMKSYIQFLWDAVNAAFAGGKISLSYFDSRLTKENVPILKDAELKIDNPLPDLEYSAFWTCYEAPNSLL